MIEYAIPSHGRASVVGAKTLRALAECGIPADNIRLFVTPDQVDEYRTQVDPGLVAEVLPSVVGLCAQRAAIEAWYPEGTRLVQADDDLRQIVRRVDDKHLTPVEDFGAVASDAFARCAEVKARFWGTYPVCNPMFMKPTVTTDLRFCIGHLFGQVVDHDPAVAIHLDQKEDYERTLRYWHADGAVVRLNDIGAKTTIGAKGGMQAPDQPDRRRINREAVAQLLEWFPDNVRIAKRRSEYGLEIRLVE